MAIIRGTAIIATFALSFYFISKTIIVEVDRNLYGKTLAASAIMALTVAAAQQAIYSKLLRPLYIAIGATTYAISTRRLKPFVTGFGKA